MFAQQFYPQQFYFQPNNTASTASKVVFVRPDDDIPEHWLLNSSKSWVELDMSISQNINPNQMSVHSPIFRSDYPILDGKSVNPPTHSNTRLTYTQTKKTSTRKSSTRKSPTRKSPTRKSPTRKSPTRKSPTPKKYNNRNGRNGRRIPRRTPSPQIFQGILPNLPGLYH